MRWKQSNLKFPIKMEVAPTESVSVLKWITQFLKDNGMSKSAEMVQNEGGFQYNLVMDPAELKSSVLQGKWPAVLREIESLTLTESVLFDVYEQVVLELIDKRDIEVAQDFLKRSAVLIALKLSAKPRFAKLESLCGLDSVTDKILYEPCASRGERRARVADVLLGAVEAARPQELLTLIHDGHKFRAFKTSKCGYSTADVGGSDSKSSTSGSLCCKATTKWRSRIAYEQNKSRPVAIAFSPDGQSLASGTSDGFIEVWSPVTGKIREDLAYQADGQLMVHGLDKEVTALAVSPDSSFIASGSIDGRIKYWDMNKGTSVWKVKSSRDPVVSLAFDALGTSVVCAHEQVINVYGVHSGSMKISHTTEGAHITSGPLVLGTGSYANKPEHFSIICCLERNRLFSTSHGIAARRQEGGDGPISDSCHIMSIVQTGPKSIIAVRSNLVREEYIVSESHFELTKMWQRPSHITSSVEAISACTSPDGKFLYVVTSVMEEAVIVFDMSDGTCTSVNMATLSEAVLSAVHHPNTNIVALTTRDSVEFLHDT